MIVEFIGCSGAGKTSLAEGLRRRIQPTGRPILSVDLVRDRPGLRWMRDPSMINLAADVISFPSFVRAYGRDGDFVASRSTDFGGTRQPRSRSTTTG